MLQGNRLIEDSSYIQAHILKPLLCGEAKKCSFELLYRTIYNMCNKPQCVLDPSTGQMVRYGPLVVQTAIESSFCWFDSVRLPPRRRCSVRSQIDDLHLIRIDDDELAQRLKALEDVCMYYNAVACKAYFKSSTVLSKRVLGV